MTEGSRQIRVEEELHLVDLRTRLPASGGEDFAWYTEQIPGVYLRLGVWDGESDETDLHHPAFTLDERALQIGARIFEAFARADRADG